MIVTASYDMAVVYAAEFEGFFKMTWLKKPA